jgi:hypothetical protein
MERSPGSALVRSRRGVRLLGFALILGGIALILLSPAPGTSPTAHAAPVLIATSPTVGTATSSVPTLDLSVSDDPSSICVLESTACPAGVGQSRVTLTAAAPQNGFLTWPAVQIAFVIETTVYDGVYDPTAGDPGSDTCARNAGISGPACEESNGVPYFVANAQLIANTIQAANPHTSVSFALVDYFATLDVQDDGDGSEYHVDIPQFVPASQFGSDTQSSLGSEVLETGYRYGDSDFSDNILHSSSITALYGAIIGSGLDWSNNTHHVVVWIGDTAPRDPSYVQDYCVSPSSKYTPGSPSGLPCFSASCEPAYAYGAISSPQCEGWVNSQNGNASDSIAGLARTAPSCTNSIGGVCTIDTIDLWATPDDPSSPGWPAADATPQLQGGPGGAMVNQNAVRVLLAGCDLAAATGGTWDGPSFFSCPSGQSGSLQPNFLGPFGTPNLQNPTLGGALRQVGFGPVTSDLVAKGTTHPLFTFVPYGNIQVLPGNAAEFRTECELPSGSLAKNCPTEPQTRNIPLGPGRNVTVYEWNWSTQPGQNVMYSGDTWVASFWVMAAGGPYGEVPVDSCTTAACAIGGSHALNGLFTAATYLPVTNVSLLVQSFPLATIDVQSPPSVSLPPTLPPPAVVPAPPGLPITAPQPILTLLGVGAQVGVASLSLQAAAAGFLAAGFTTISVRNRPMSIAVAALAQKTGPVRSRFEEASAAKDASGIGRFE